MYEENLMYKITWFYYMNNMTQKEIADQLGISRMKVVKLLNQAKTEGIIKFTINRDATTRMNLERLLIEKFQLDDVFIVPSTNDEVNDNIAKGAAQYIEEKVEPNAFINIGYGDTISHTISHLIYSSEKPLSLVTLSGGVSYYTSAIIAGATKKLSKSVTPNIHIIPAPLLVSSEEVSNILYNESNIKSILNMSKLSSMSLVGIGAVSEEATIFKYNIVNDQDLILLKMKGAVGDILSQFYDKDGNIIDSHINKRLIGIQIETLKTSPNTIGIAGGKEKVQAIYSALLGGYLNVLITDEDTAAALLTFENA